MNFRKWILALTVLVLFAGLASAQVIGGGGGSNLQCVANAAAPPQLRSEGYTELTGDITLNCTGGTPTAQGAAIPTANVTVYLNGTVTSRLLSSSGGASEALLLIDEPGSGLQGYGPTVPISMCTSALQASNSCTEYAGSYIGGVPTPPNPAGTCTAAAPCLVPLSTAAAALIPQTTYANAGYNAWQGTVSGSSVTFFGVPVLPPGSTGTRVFRITNVRVNANGITGGGPIPANVVDAISISPPTALPVGNPQLTTGFIASSLSTAVGNVGGGKFSNATPGLTQPIQCSNPNGNGKLLAQGDLQYNELFATAFKTRVSPNAPGGGTGQSSTAQQNVPGFIYNSESGFIPYTGGSPTLAPMGLADYGTRLKATFNNIPSGVSVYVSTVNIIGGQAGPPLGTNATATTYAVLITGETAPENGSTAPTVVATGSTSNGGQGVTFTTKIPYYQLPVVNNSAVAVWEIVQTLPNVNETAEFVYWLSYTASPGTNSPAPGTMTVNMAYAPNPSGGLFTAAQGGAASSSLTIPRFADTSTATNAAQVTICSTALLFPFITNTNGFDTGVAIANTSTDPFGTSSQAGTCTLNWYGNATTTSNPAASTLGAGGVGSTTPIASGTVVTALASTTVPGFQGYMIAVCNFQYAHGFAFVSDLGARNLAMGYLPLIMNAPSGAYRPTGSAEQLDQ